jgi:uncharacterized protein (DUF2147 family)
MQKSRDATKTSSRVAAFVAFVAAAVLLEGRGAHAASSGICKTPTNFKPDVTFEAPGFGTQTCQSTVNYWQGEYGQVCTPFHEPPVFTIGCISGTDGAS